jgi:hypothetical protein
MARQIDLLRKLEEGAMNEVITKIDMTNGGEDAIRTALPYQVRVTIQGSCDLLFHAWNCEAVAEKGAAAKNSKAKKTDNVESYVYRTPDGQIGLPGEYLRQSIIHSAKFMADPRSPRKSAMDLYKAGIISLTELAPLGPKTWDYLSRKRVGLNRVSITRERPAMRAGWKATFDLQVLLPEYIAPDTLRATIEQAGRLIGVGDWRPTYGRFGLVLFK